jgi:hypothetical protein
VSSRLPRRFPNGLVNLHLRKVKVRAAQQSDRQRTSLTPVTRLRVPVRAEATIGDTAALITHPETGKYPHKTPFRSEIERALEYASLVWGAETLWSAIDEANYIALLRRRLSDLVANGKNGVRATEITISRLIGVVRWLRESKHIPRDAAPWPNSWKPEIRRFWKGLNKTSRDPEPKRLRFTHDEALKILKAASFDPRYQLLMWLGMELRLGQVSRARRSDLELPPVDWDAPANNQQDYGTFTVHGAGKKRGTIVDLTRGQRRMVDRALGSGGYLQSLEESGYEYCLFPAGYVVGRVAHLRGRETAITLSQKINADRHVSTSWLRKNFLVAEEIAGISHVPGRGVYGIRRMTVDLGDEENISLSGLKALGGWDDIETPSAFTRRVRTARAVVKRAACARSCAEKTR